MAHKVIDDWKVNSKANDDSRDRANVSGGALVYAIA